MIQSPIKFDDLAFILLFFFMIIAVVSFSDSMKVETVEQSTDTQKSDDENLMLFLDESGKLILEGNEVTASSFSSQDLIDLSCSDNISWEIIARTVREISETGASVSLVI